MPLHGRKSPLHRVRGAVLLPRQEQTVGLRQLRVVLQTPGPAVDALPVTLKAAVVDGAVPVGVLDLRKGFRAGEGHFRVKPPQVRTVDVLHQQPERTSVLCASVIFRYGEAPVLKEAAVDSGFSVIGLFQHVSLAVPRQLINVVLTLVISVAVAEAFHRQGAAAAQQLPGQFCGGQVLNGRWLQIHIEPLLYVGPRQRLRCRTEIQGPQ